MRPIFALQGIVSITVKSDTKSVNDMYYSDIDLYVFQNRNPFTWGIRCVCEYQRIFISDRRVSPPLVPPIVVKRKHSPNLSLLCLQHLIIPVRLYNCRQSRQREVGWVLPMDNDGGTDPSITNKYSLVNMDGVTTFTQRSKLSTPTIQNFENYDSSAKLFLQ